jgi:GAF domain-containing protein
VRALRELGQLSVLDLTLPEMLQRVVAIANDTVVPSVRCGPTLDVAGRASTAAYTDDEVPEIEAAQYDANVGPCLDAAREGAVFTIPSTARDERWRPFSDACAARGMHSTLSTPVLARSAKRAALNFYSTQERAFDEQAIAVADVFAKQAAVVIENAEAYYSAKQLAEQLALALDTRIVIEQAKGILIGQGHTGDDAFDVLRRSSQRLNRKLHLIAADLVAETEQQAKSFGDPHDG